MADIEEFERRCSIEMRMMERRVKTEAELRLKVYQEWYRIVPDIGHKIQWNLKFTYTCLTCGLPQLPNIGDNEYQHQCEVCGEQVPCDKFCVNVMGEIGMEECRKCGKRVVGACCYDANMNMCLACKG